MKDPSSRTRLLGLALALVLISLIAGDRTRAQTAIEVGMDPLSVLDLQVKANAVVVLDSSGSMREVPTASSIVTGISNGELVADDPKSKMAQAKSVLQEIIQANDQKVKFRFLMYDEPDSYSLVSDDRFYYATSDTNAAALQINAGSTGSASPGISRTAGSDDITIGGTAWHYLRASQFWNGQTINTDGKVIDGVADPKPRVFLRNDNLLEPCTIATANCVQFDFMGANFTRGSGGTCQTDKELVQLAGCDKVDQYTDSIGNYLQPELKITTTGAIDGYDNATPATMPTPNGIRAVGGTPIALSLTEIKTWFGGVWTGMAGTARKPRTFVVLVTDGDDQCSTFVPPAGNTDPDYAYNQNALKAAYRAEQLYRNADTSTPPDPLSSVTTYVVVYGGAAGVKRANWIAWAGSGLSVPATSEADTDALKRWSREPTAAEVAACKAKGGCIDAFTTSGVADLQKAIQSAIDQGSGSGQFAASAVVAEPIWEYGRDAGLDPWGDPERRFDAFTSIVFQPTFDASNFDGRLTAWGYGGVDGSGNLLPPIKKWEAGSKLANADSATSPGTPGIYIAKGPSTGCPTGAAAPCPTFAKLRGTTLNDALIKRRIYTSSRNGVFSGTGRTATQLWPPAATVAPADNTAGTLDRALGIVGAGTAAEFTSLQTEYGACVGTPLHADCSSADLATKIARARREAREVILAHMAGADPQLTAGGNPVRCQATATAAACDYAGSIVYRRRSWVLAESTNATPAVVSAPLQIVPKNHETDYLRLRDGVWSGSTNVNVGLRNPDKVDKTRSDRTTVIANANYKPIMTVTYLATNGMLHAFRAGPCINSTMATTPGSCPLSTAVTGSYNTGGEELWGFVPFDQLRKLRELRQPPKRDPHTYMLASSLRIADIYEPTGTTTGEWRVVLYFGRGLGGKYLTALDITNPGPASMAAFDANPPKVLWNRGNPDTLDGTSTGTAAGIGSSDGTAYAKMGQTWSVPAISAVAMVDNTTTRNPGGVEFVAYVGSGYSPVATEGSTVFALDAITGDVVGSYDVGDRGSAGSFGGATFENAIVASPAVLLPSTYSFESFVHPSDAYAARVYVGDLHGRLWSFPPKGGAAFAPLLGSYFADLGADQPIANGVALLYYDSDATKKSAHVYVETGNDKRVAKPGDTPPFNKTPPFYMVGMRDEEATSTATPSSNTLVQGPAKELFAKPLPNDVPTEAPGYRGTVQPTVTFNSQRLGRVLFAGNQFTPAGTSCLSRLDAILFALSARDGVAAYDLNAEGQDEYYIIPNQVILQLDIVRVPPESGRLNISQAIPCDPSTDPTKCTDPPATVKPPKNSSVAPAVRSDVYPLEMKFASAVCR